MLSEAIRNAAEHNEFDLETWAHEARKLEDALSGTLEEFTNVVTVNTEVIKQLNAENAELRAIADDALDMLVSWQVDWERMANDRDYLPDLNSETKSLRERMKVFRD